MNKAALRLAEVQEHYVEPTLKGEIWEILSIYTGIRFETQPEQMD